jgi:hypothetical protein
VITIPKDYGEELFGSFFYEIFKQAKDKDFDSGKLLRNVTDVGVYSESSIQPILQVALAYKEWLEGQNPEDLYRNRPAIPQNVLGAGRLREATYMLGWSAEKIFGGFFKGAVEDIIDAASGKRKILYNSPLETALEFPVLGRIPAQLIRRADGGEREAQRDAARRERNEKKRAAMDKK